jgi:hypothetical protein
MDSEEKDDRQYTNKFIKKCKKSNHHKKSHTNTYSNSYARPGHENGTVENTRLINNDIVNYKAIDYAPSKELWRKTAAPSIISHDYVAHNSQIHSTNSNYKSSINNPSKIRLVSLPLIHKNMHLATFDTVLNHQNILLQSKILVVINLSNDKLAKGCYCEVYNIDFEDSISISYKKFQHTAVRVIDIIGSIDDDNKFVICCDKAVNRSVSMIILYNLMNKNKSLQTPDATIEYIINQKNDKYWPVLNNLKFYHYIMATYQSNNKSIG